MLGRVKRLFRRRSTEQRSSREAPPALEMQVEAAAAPVAACLQVRAVTLDEFFAMMMENRLREEREELGAGGDAAIISPDSSEDLGVEERPRAAARLWRWRSPLRERRRRSRRHKILQRLKKLCCLRVADQEVEEEEDHRPRRQVGESLEEQRQPNAVEQKDAVPTGLDTLQKKPLLSFEKFLFLSLLLDQLKRWDKDDGNEDEGYEGDVEESLPSTSAAVRIVAATTSQPPGGALPLRERRRRRRQGHVTLGKGGRRAGRLRGRRSYRLFSRLQS